MVIFSGTAKSTLVEMGSVDTIACIKLGTIGAYLWKVSDSYRTCFEGHSIITQHRRLATKLSPRLCSPSRRYLIHCRICVVERFLGSNIRTVIDVPRTAMFGEE
jgi:hypothetical protein